MDFGFSIFDFRFDGIAPHGTKSKIENQKSKKLPLCVLCVFAVNGLAVMAGEPGEGAGTPTNYDEVVYALAANLGRDEATAQDAALKLAKLGKRAVPALAEILKANLVAAPPAGNPQPENKAKTQLVHYAVLALARIKAHEAARLLLPLLKDEKADPELRSLALEAYGLQAKEGSGPGAREQALPEAIPVLLKIAGSDPDIQIRRKAFVQLSLLETFWVESEKVVINGLSDPDDEIRALAAKLCWYVPPLFKNATDKLIELAEKDSAGQVRSFALLALSRLKPAKAVPAVVRICARPDLSGTEQRQAFNLLAELTGIKPKDAAAVESWWKEKGQAQYGKEETAGKKQDEAKDEHAIGH